MEIMHLWWTEVTLKMYKIGEIFEVETIEWVVDVKHAGS